ncbi:MAG: BON domain-containing protein [Methylococcales bacterium]|jgi:osmotically-inducible protein OsmY|nr:BON domain-containing protein [Methylococcales bacterium]
MKLILIISCFAILSGCAAAVIGSAAATGVAVIHDRRSAGAVLDDETIELSALSQILQHEELRQYTHLNVTSYNYLALITGEAPNEALKLVAEKLVKNIDNVRAVYNEVQISAPSAVLSRSSDSLITTKVKTGLFKYINTPKFDPTRVKVVTENGTVFLMGLLTEAEANMVSDYTRTVGGVEKVVKIIEYIPEQKK